MQIEIHNHGPLILASNYWESDCERTGKIFLSPNAGAVRLLWPRSLRQAIEDMRAAQYAVCSLGPWPEQRLDQAVEILWEDGSDSPYSVHLSPASCGALPGEPAAGREWVISVWDLKKNRPHKALERICHWRRVPAIPWLKPWAG